MSSETTRPSAFWALAGLLVPVGRALAKIAFVDPEKLPADGACVIAPNHYSEIDPIIVGIAAWKLGRAPHYLAKASLFRIPVFGWLLRKCGQVPVERGNSRGGATMRAAGRLTEQGRCLIVYPEGTLTREPDLWPMRGKTGAARLALELGVPVIPMAHWGTQQILGRYSKKISLFPRKKVTVAFGDPVDLDAFRGKPVDSATLAAATEAIMADITRLLEGLRNEKAPLERWNPTVHNQKETGRFEA